MIPKFALIIQGPMQSIGRTGKTMSNPFFSLQKGSVVNFNCEKNIIKIVNDFEYLFDTIILSCWKNDIVSERITRLKKLIICRSDSFENYYSERYNKDLSPNFSGHNKYRQIFSTLKGVEKADDLKCDYIIKIRTDSFLNLEICVEAIKSNYPFFNKRIAVPYKIDDAKPFLEDIYFGGNTKIIKNCLNSVLNNYEIKKSIHYHIFYAWLFKLNECFHKKSIFRNWFPLYPSLTKYDKLLDKICWNFFFTPLPKKVWGSLAMRGQKRYDLDYNFQDELRVFYLDKDKKFYRKKINKRIKYLDKVFFLINCDYIAKYFFKKEIFRKHDLFLFKAFRVIHKMIFFPHLLIIQLFKAIIFSNTFWKITKVFKND